jgi:hypothetical protein
MKRAITTAIGALKHCKNIKNAKFIIHPFLSACIEGTMDIPSQSLESGKSTFLAENLDVEIATGELESYSDYKKHIPKHLMKNTDFVEFIDSLFANPKYYFLKYFSDKMQKDLILAFYEDREMTVQDYIVKRLEKTQHFENENSLKKRVEVARNYLKNLIPNLGEDEHILVVTHSKFNKRFAQPLDKTKYQQVSVRNGEAVYMSHVDFTL